MVKNTKKLTVVNQLVRRNIKMKYHVELTWNKKKQVYTCKCLEFPTCMCKHEDPKTAIDICYFYVNNLLERRKSLGVETSENMEKCPCCHELSFQDGLCSFCSYEQGVSI